MTVLPVIGREMRAQSRLPLTYWLRVIGASVLLVVCLVFGFTQGLSASLGGILFAHLHLTLFLAIWVLVPMLCADCISRERREGTIGLLFLTPLKARDVVMAKGLIHGLRALSLLLAALPVVTIALLLGGVGWRDAALSLFMNFSALCWALAAGLLASSISKSWLRSQLVAYGLVICFGSIFLLLDGSTIARSAKLGLWMPVTGANVFDQAMLIGFLDATNFEGWWGQVFAKMPPARHSGWLLIHVRMALISMGGLLLSIEIAARNLRRFWREEPPSARRAWIEKKMFTPILAVDFLKGWMRRKLERNPIGWLEQRTWSGRLVTWGWFAVMISVYSAAFNNAYVDRALDALQKILAWLLLGVIAVSASGSFQRERETGVLELLLVSPMTVGQIIGGRVRGLWGQFLPAFALLLGIWAFLSYSFPGQRTAPALIVFFCGAFLTLPIIGLYYSLRRASLISAFLNTLFTALAVPLGLKLIFYLLIQSFLGLNAFYFPELAAPRDAGSFNALLFYALLRLVTSPLFPTLLQLVLAGWIWRRLYRDMTHRNFAFSRAAT